MEKYANPYRFKSNLMAGSRLTSISWSGGVQVRAVSHINSAKTLKCKRAIGHTLKTVSHGKTNLCHANTGVPRGGGRWAAVSRASYPHVGPRVAASAHEKNEWPWHRDSAHIARSRASALGLRRRARHSLRPAGPSPATPPKKRCTFV